MFCPASVRPGLPARPDRPGDAAQPCRLAHERQDQAEAYHARAAAVAEKTRNLVALEAEDAYLRWAQYDTEAKKLGEAAKGFDDYSRDLPPSSTRKRPAIPPSTTSSTPGRRRRRCASRPSRRSSAAWPSWPIWSGSPPGRFCRHLSEPAAADRRTNRSAKQVEHRRPRMVWILRRRSVMSSPPPGTCAATRTRPTQEQAAHEVIDVAQRAARSRRPAWFWSSDGSGRDGRRPGRFASAW